MGFAEKYLQKNTSREIDIQRAPSGLLKYIVIIPCFCEPEINKTLVSLQKCTSGKHDTEVIILVNYSENTSNELKLQNEETYNELLEWSETNSTQHLNFFPLIARNLPSKHAGAGLARKMAMDCALKRFSEKNIPDGIIFSLDADTLVPYNYLMSVDKLLEKSPKHNCFIFNFNHPSSGLEYSQQVYDSAILYEMHLRYYKQMLLRSGFPYYHYTIGSCFAINAKLYADIGGMNKRKAGEDFYFLQKVFPNAKTAFLRDVILIPSPRPSWRVPFGTGPTVRKMLGPGRPAYKTYNPVLFHQLSELIKMVPSYYKAPPKEMSLLKDALPESLQYFFYANNFLERVSEINNNSSSLKSFTKRFYSWFDAFMVIKYFNFAKVEYYRDTDVADAVKQLLGLKKEDEITSETLISMLRNIETD